MKHQLCNLNENVEGYKKSFIDSLKKGSDLKCLDNVIINVDNGIELFVITDSISESYLEELGVYNLLNELNGKINISIFCSSKCTPLINYFLNSQEYILELGCFRWLSLPNIPIVKDNCEHIEFKVAPVEADRDKLMAKLKHDFLEPYRKLYSDDLISKYIRELEVAFTQPFIHAVKNGEVVGYLVDEPYYEKRLQLEYYLVGFIWLDRHVLSKKERGFISRNFFNHISRHKPPFGVLVNITHNVSRNYFEKNGFVPNWIRAELRNAK